MGDPYFHTDNDYYRSQDKEWDRVIDLERKAEEIRNDPDLLEKAIEEYAQQMQEEEATQSIIDKCEYLGRQAI